MMRTILHQILRSDWLLTMCMIGLITYGVLFIQSAAASRSVAALQHLGQEHFQMACVGLLVYFLCASLDYRKVLDFLSTPIYVTALILLLAVLLFGSMRFGGRRWLWFFQPSEIAKLATILFIAQVFGGHARTGFKWFCAALLTLGAPAVLILQEPDLGTTLVLVPAALVMFLASRTWTKGFVTLVLIGLLGVGSVLGLVSCAEHQSDPVQREKILNVLPLKKHQVKRICVFLFPDRDVKGDGYNLRQAQISIGSGSLWGKGLRKGSQKTLGYLPPTVATNDFIFCVVAEEAGFAGSLGMLLLYGVILLACARVALRATDDRGRVLVLGIATLLFCHVYENIAMCIGLMPITGLPLPFISAGRTFLLVSMAALGFVQSVDIHPTSFTRSYNPKEELDYVAH